MIEKQRKLRKKLKNMSVSSKTAEMNALKRAQLCDQQRLRAKIHTVYSQDIYLVAYQNLDLLLKSKIEKNTKYY